jgi:uncharacterized secreted repeat protein (TIGR03808 family)
VAGATRLVFGGGDFMLRGTRCERVSLTNLVIDGAGRGLAEFVPGLVHIAECDAMEIENCAVSGSTRAGIALDRCAGRVTRTSLSGVSEVAIRALESRGLSLTGNTISECGAGGISVLRWNAGEDGTIVASNRISSIAAKDSGDGASGSGISIFRANGVMVTGNQIANCAASAVRITSAANVQVAGNTCRASGGAAIRAEAGFAGLMIAHNIVAGAATGIDLAGLPEGSDLAAVIGNIVRGVATSRT